jgi:hypothetical protein
VSTLHSACWNHSHECRCHICVFKHHTACGNYTPSVEIPSAYRNYTLRLEITLYVYKTHSCVLKSQCACEHHTQEWFLHAECGFDKYVCHNHTHTCHHTSHSACRNHSCVCLNRECRSHICMFKRTLRLEITLICV